MSRTVSFLSRLDTRNSLLHQVISATRIFHSSFIILNRTTAGLLELGLRGF